MALQAGLGDDSKTQPVALVKELTDAFGFFDLSEDGKLSVQEMATVVRSLSDEIVVEADLVELIRVVDADGDGCLDLQEFIDLNTRADDQLRERASPENDALVAAFSKFDGDRDGFISAEELHHVVAGFGDPTYSLEACRDMISGADENGDQMMSVQELRDLMNDDPTAATAEALPGVEGPSRV